MKRIALISAMSLTVLWAAAQTTDYWRGDDRSGVYKETGLLKSWPADGPQLLWSCSELSVGYSSPAIASDKIYLTGLQDGTGYIYVLDLNGKLLNKKEYGPEWDKNWQGSRATLNISEGKIYLESGMGDIYCFDQNTLNVLWQKNIVKDFDAKNITWGVTECPLIIGDKLICTPGGQKNNVVALNKNTGEVIWSCAGEGDLSAYCSPIYLADQQVPQIVTMTAQHIIGVEAATGKMLWSYEHINKNNVHANTPVYGDNMILCSSGYGKGSVMLRLLDGGRRVEKVWESPLPDNRIGGMVKVGDYAYGSGDVNKFWFCIDWKSGEIKYQSSDLDIGAVIAADGMLYCYTQKGNMALVKIDPSKFDIVSRFKVTLGSDNHWAHPVIHQGVLYVRHGDTLMAYKVGR